MCGSLWLFFLSPSPLPPPLALPVKDAFRLAGKQQVKNELPKLACFYFLFFRSLKCLVQTFSEEKLCLVNKARCRCWNHLFLCVVRTSLSNTKMSSVFGVIFIFSEQQGHNCHRGCAPGPRAHKGGSTERGEKYIDIFWRFYFKKWKSCKRKLYFHVSRNYLFD